MEDKRWFVFQALFLCIRNGDDKMVTKGLLMKAIPKFYGKVEGESKRQNAKKVEVRTEIMYKADLLEKTQQILFKIIETLYLNDGPVSKQTLTQSFKLSPATLKRYLEDLQTDVQPLIDEKRFYLRSELTQQSLS